MKSRMEAEARVWGSPVLAHPEPPSRREPRKPPTHQRRPRGVPVGPLRRGQRPEPALAAVQSRSLCHRSLPSGVAWPFGLESPQAGVRRGGAGEKRTHGPTRGPAAGLRHYHRRSVDSATKPAGSVRHDAA